MTKDCIADGTNTIAITTTTRTEITTGVATAITIVTMIMTATMTTIANWKPLRSNSMELRSYLNFQPIRSRGRTRLHRSL